MSTKYGVAFALLATMATIAAGAAGLGVVRPVAGWAALGFGLVAVGFFGVGPRILGKRPDGRREPWAWPLFGPYFALNGLAFGLYRLIDRRPPFAPIAPNLWLGRRLTVREVRRAGTPQWVAVLDLASEFAEAPPLREVAAYRSMPVLDGAAPTPDDLAAAVLWLAEHTPRGPVLVHCALGHGRSATVAAAFLLATGCAATVEQAMATIRKVRPGVGWNPAQGRALHAFAPTLRR